MVGLGERIGCRSNVKTVVKTVDIAILRVYIKYMAGIKKADKIPTYDIKANIENIITSNFSPVFSPSLRIKYNTKFLMIGNTSLPHKKFFFYYNQI